jgi:chemotaxis protein methyltransferase CheR
MAEVDYAQWAPVAAWFGREIGFVLTPERYYLVHANCRELLEESRLGTPQALADAANKDPRLRQRLINAGTINESFFFRDVNLWHDLGTRVLPDLAKECAFRRRIEVLICACSRGQEVYTLAMLAAERAAELQGVSLAITAADIDTEVMGIARAGRYSDLEVGRGLSPERRERFFMRSGDGWQVRPELQAGVNFTQINLNTPFTFPVRYDLVFCRNVLIYFSTAARKTVVDRLGNYTSNWGWLVLGGAETLLGISDTWNPRRMGDSTFYQKRYG